MSKEVDQRTTGDSVQHELYVVKAKDIVPMIIEWCERWDKTHNTRRRYGKYMTYAPDVFVMFAREVIAEHTGFTRARIDQYLQRKTGHIAYSVADALLKAIDKEYMLDTGEIEVIPNPMYSKEKWDKRMKERGVL